MLRSTGIQPGKSRCRGKTRTTTNILSHSSTPWPPSLAKAATPILFLEPSCWSMFVEDYRELKIDNAENIAARCFLFEKFVDDLLAQQPDALRFNERDETNVANSSALPCQIDSQSGFHGETRRTFARKKSHSLGHRLLRNGRRIRRARREIRSLGAGRPAFARSNRQSTIRNRSDRLGHKLPTSNHGPNERAAKTHGRIAR